MDKNFDLEIFCDGGARGNPGPAACAFVVKNKSKIIFKVSKFLGKTTNNVAEYSAVIEALSWLGLTEKHGFKIAFFLDSQLVVRQLRGVYKIKKEHLKRLYLKVKTIEKKFELVDYFYIPREQNFLPDKLLNKKLDETSATS